MSDICSDNAYIYTYHPAISTQTYLHLQKHFQGGSGISAAQVYGEVAKGSFGRHGSNIFNPTWNQKLLLVCFYVNLPWYVGYVPVLMGARLDFVVFASFGTTTWSST